MQLSKLSHSHTSIRITGVSLTVIACFVAFVAWADTRDWQFSDLSAYTLFPLLGLIAFSILWSQYTALTIAKIFKAKHSALSLYFTITGWIFLVAIFLHPGLLVWQLWHDGFGLPPESYLKHYVAPGLAWAALLGSVSFLIFLSYELRRWFVNRSWWKLIAYASDIAALAIFIHSIKLGTTLQSGWFHNVWLLYGITLICSLCYLRIYPLFAAKINV